MAAPKSQTGCKEAGIPMAAHPHSSDLLPAAPSQWDPEDCDKTIREDQPQLLHLQSENNPVPGAHAQNPPRGTCPSATQSSVWQSPCWNGSDSHRTHEPTFQIASQAGRPRCHCDADHPRPRSFPGSSHSECFGQRQRQTQSPWQKPSKVHVNQRPAAASALQISEKSSRPCRGFWSFERNQYLWAAEMRSYPDWWNFAETAPSRATAEPPQTMLQRSSLFGGCRHQTVQRAPLWPRRR